MVEDVLVDGDSVGRVTSYTFKDLDADATIAATFMPFAYRRVPPLSPTRTPSSRATACRSSSRSTTPLACR